MVTTMKVSRRTARLMLQTLKDQFTILNGWNITFTYTRPPGIHKVDGLCVYDEDKHKAKIFISPRTWKNPTSFKLTLIHELLHIVLASYKYDSSVNEERLIDELSSMILETITLD